MEVATVRAYTGASETVIRRAFHQVPCGFLLGENECEIYEVRPLVCLLYPAKEVRVKQRPGQSFVGVYTNCAAGKELVEVLREYIRQKGKPPEYYVDSSWRK